MSATGTLKVLVGRVGIAYYIVFSTVALSTVNLLSTQCSLQIGNSVSYKRVGDCTGSGIVLHGIQYTVIIQSHSIRNVYSG